MWYRRFPHDGFSHDLRELFSTRRNRAPVRYSDNRKRGVTMQGYRLGEIETKFAHLIWDNEPLPSGKLVELCTQILDWKKSTTYTVLRKLCDKGMFQNKDGTITSLISRQEFYAIQSEHFVDETFSGALPQFLTAFTRRRKLSRQDIDEILSFIQRHKD